MSASATQAAIIMSKYTERHNHGTFRTENEKYHEVHGTFRLVPSKILPRCRCSTVVPHNTSRGGCSRRLIGWRTVVIYELYSSSANGFRFSFKLHGF